MKGLILPAGSPLVQFEVLRPPAGAHPSITRAYAKEIKDGPWVLWVSRISVEDSNRTCQCRAAYFVFGDVDNVDAKTGSPSMGQPAICLCMGRFLE